MHKNKTMKFTDYLNEKSSNSLENINEARLEKEFKQFLDFYKKFVDQINKTHVKQLKNCQDAFEILKKDPQNKEARMIFLSNSGSLNGLLQLNLANSKMYSDWFKQHVENLSKIVYSFGTNIK